MRYGNKCIIQILSGGVFALMTIRLPDVKNGSLSSLETFGRFDGFPWSMLDIIVIA